MKELPFSIVPVEAAMDDRLSKGELRVRSEEHTSELQSH